MPIINLNYEQGGSTSKGKPNLVLPRESEGEVRRTEDGREYVMYRNEDTGEMVKVFGSWNEAPRVRERDEQGMGKFMSIDTSFNYPVTQNENGEFVLDEAMLDTEQEGDGPTMVYDPEHGRKMPVAPVGNLLKQLEQQREGYSGVDKFSPTVRRGISMSAGGATKKRTYSYDNGGSTKGPGDPEKKPVTMETFAADADEMRSMLSSMGSPNQFFRDKASEVGFIAGTKYAGTDPETGGALTHEKAFLQGKPSGELAKMIYDQFDLLTDFTDKIDASGVKKLPDWEGSDQQQLYETVLQYIKELGPYSNVYLNQVQSRNSSRSGKYGMKTNNGMRSYRYGGRAEDGLTTNNPNGDPEKKPITMESFAPRLEQFQGRMARLGGSPEGAVDSIGKKHNAFAPGSWEQNYENVSDSGSWGARFGADVTSALTGIERAIAEIESSGLMDSKDWSGSEAEKVYNELLKYVEPLKEASVPYNQYRNRMRQTREGANGLRTYSYGANTGEGETDPEKPKTKTVADFNREDYKWADDLLDLRGVIERSNRSDYRLETDPEYALDFANVVNTERMQYDDLVNELRNMYGIKPGMKWEDLEGYEGSELQKLITYLAPRRNELSSFVSKAMKQAKN